MAALGTLTCTTISGAVAVTCMLRNHPRARERINLSGFCSGPTAITFTQYICLHPLPSRCIPDFA